MLHAVIIGMQVTPDILGQIIKPRGKVLNHEVIKITGNLVMILLLPIRVKYGTLIGPNVTEVIKAGSALVLQEWGNLGSVLIAMQLAALLGIRRESIGDWCSISRETSLESIGENYSFNNLEGAEILRSYMV